MLDAALRQALLAMSAEDQRIRKLVVERYPLGGAVEPALAEEWANIDRHNTARLRQVVDEHGWPGRSLVGNDGATAAWHLLNTLTEIRTSRGGAWSCPVRPYSPGS